MKRKYLSLLLVLPVIMFSCGKELSVETGKLPGDSTAPVTTNCSLAKIVEVNQATSKAGFSFVSSFNSENKVVTLDVIDSAANLIYGSFGLSYPAGRIQVDADQYFVVGSDGRVTEFHGYETPADNTSERFVVKYAYNSAGQLALRTEAYDTLPNVVQFQMKYTYSNGNLVKEDIEAFGGANFVKLADIAYSYDASKPVKNFLTINGVAPEIFMFQTAINTGVKNTNALTRAVTTRYQPTNGAVVDAVTTNFGNYVIDSKSYVQSFDVTGADFVAGLSAGYRYRLGYNCY